EGFPIVYNNKLYMQFGFTTKNNTGYTQLAQSDGNTLSFITNPQDNNNHELFYIGSPIVYNDKLYLQYGNYLAEYDGTNLTLIANQTPKVLGASREFELFYKGSPFIFNKRLYLHCGDWLG